MLNAILVCTNCLQLISHLVNFTAQRICLCSQLLCLVDHGFLGLNCASGDLNLILSVVNLGAKVFNFFLHSLLLDKFLLYLFDVDLRCTLVIAASSLWIVIWIAIWLIVVATAKLVHLSLSYLQVANLHQTVVKLLQLYILLWLLLYSFFVPWLHDSSKSFGIIEIALIYDLKRLLIRIFFTYLCFCVFCQQRFGWNFIIFEDLYGNGGVWSLAFWEQQ